jgi:hypothetical protein
MKTARTLLAGLALVGSLGIVNVAKAQDDIIEKVPLQAGSYCHEKFPAMRARTLGTDDPTLKSENDGDVIDFYGPCDENPTGKDQIHEQEIQQELFRDHNFND